VIETTVSNVGAELARRGLDPDDRVTITIEPDELIPGRRASRARVIAAGNGGACGRAARRPPQISRNRTTAFRGRCPSLLCLLIDPDTRAWLRKLMAAAELVTITERIAACRDPTDDKFLELAVIVGR
jgi:hypothetical protein